MAKRPSVRFVFAVFLTAFASLWLTWGTLAPRVLFHFDSGNFALAHYYFHPALNQPHLPGYPLFVALSHVVALFTDGMQTNFLFCGMLAGAGALSFLFLLADAQFGRKAALIATALLFLNPAFLTGGLTNQVRVYLALIACATAWFGWKVLTGDRPARSLLVGAFVVALLCGFRPEMLLLMMPLLFGPAIVRRLKWPLAAALALYLLTAAPWQAFTVWRTGGEVFAPARLSEAGARIAKYIEVSGRYVAQETQRDSPVFGAGVGGALSLVGKAIVWTFQGLWPALILVTVFGLWRHTERRQRLLFALWFLPLFAFHATVHIADPDHALSTIPALCLIAGGMLAKMD
ncbi:MAG: glycosyltransferase family 39 protein [Bryobacterales bacterium]|nr:glycosyltransferase family 39 protein [Bryobacterales bacterium]